MYIYNLEISGRLNHGGKIGTNYEIHHMNELWLSRHHEGQTKHSLYDCVSIGLRLVALFKKKKKKLMDN